MVLILESVTVVVRVVMTMRMAMAGITACTQKEYARTVYQQPDYGYKDC